MNNRDMKTGIKFLLLLSFRSLSYLLKLKVRNSFKSKNSAVKILKHNGYMINSKSV